MARHAEISGSRLRHLFRIEAGCPPREFLEQERLRRAREMLAPSRLNMAEIAESLGFENAFYFSTRFRRHSGESPSAYRRRLAGN